jgi:hypothetical protein
MRKLIMVAVAVFVFGGSVDAAVGLTVPAKSGARPTAVLAKTCPAGFTRGVIGGEQKCLHAGEYCSHSEARQYRRYHFVCERVRGTYRLEHS